MAEAAARFDRSLPGLRPLAGGSLPTQIHEALEEAIIGGEFAPGARLLADEIAAGYGVSRIPVREALSSLREAGWVASRPRYGVYVLERTREELVELFEARAGIEQEIARFAAERRTEEGLARLRIIVEASRSASAHADADAVGEAAVAFNAALRDAGGNGVLSGLSLGLEKRARFYFSPVAALLGDDWVTGQDRLLRLLVSGDVEGAGRSARQHIEDTGRAVSALLGSDAFTS